MFAKNTKNDIIYQDALIDALKIKDTKNTQVITVVGAGGKTTIIHTLAKEFVAKGKKVLITTSTHMWEEEGTIVTNKASDIINEINKCGYVMAGTREKAKSNNNHIKSKYKITSLYQDIWKEVINYCDIVLVEGDGSREFPIKVPGENEPVIPTETTQILVIMGLSAIGKPINEVCHRYQLICKQCSINENYIVNSNIYKILMNKYVKRLKKNHENIKISCILNQADNIILTGIAVGICDKLTSIDCVITSLVHNEQEGYNAYK